MTLGLTADEPETTFILPRRRWAMAFGSVAASLALLATSVYLVDARQVVERLSATDPRWFLGFFAIYLLQVALLGLRWSVIARQLAVPLGWARASSEYALSILINQLLPTGFAGDGWRALRHTARSSGHTLPRIVEALALDRLSGTVTLLGVVLLTAPFAVSAGIASSLHLSLGVALVGLTAWAAARWAKRRPVGQGALGAFAGRARAVLFAPRQAAGHLFLSLLLMASHLGQLWLAARAAGMVLDVELLCWLGPLISLAAAAPSFFGSWGVREGASALLFASAGLPSSAGVAVSLLFGCFSLACAMPGAIVMLFDWQSGALGGGSSSSSPTA